MSTISASGSNNNHTGLGCLQSILTVDKAKQTSVKGTSPLVELFYFACGYPRCTELFQLRDSSTKAGGTRFTPGVVFAN